MAAFGTNRGARSAQILQQLDDEPTLPLTWSFVSG